ncbi:phytoene desaturase family protein [Austwickia chelonae]|uniref:phytoene desaturase family protein n=1 Tax=Austwickia chelonae TaxID=100225 RepID=UPI000E27C950|nr:NAD(P)/FAD-dependent oxidoreductase [Austwickia chelonae]
MSTDLPTEDRAFSPGTLRRSPGVDETVDAVVIGAGHHGLVTAAVLADAGWDVLVLEARPTVGGAVNSVVRGGWTTDEFSACHPLALASPVLRALELENHGLRWARARVQVAHLSRPQESDVPAICRQAADTAEILGQDDPRDARTWLRLAEQYDAVKGPFLEALLTAWPPVSATRRLVSAVGARHMPDFVRFMMLPSSRMGEELFRGKAARDLLAGNAMHADVPPTAPVSGVFGWLMAMLAQDVGFPSPVGGTGELARALAHRAQAAGARVDTGSAVTRVVVRGRRVHGVEVADGRRIVVRRAVVADTSAQALYGRLLDPEVVPAGVRTRLTNFLWDLPTVKLNYRLSGPVPWTAGQARGAGVVHVGLDAPGMVRWTSQLETGVLPEEPFALVGQMTSIDSSRSPSGTETLWLYTHLPRGMTHEGAVRQVVQSSERMMDRFAPDWRDLIVDRWEQTPSGMEAADANLGEGAVGGGTQQLFQQALWRPFTGAGGPRTHVGGLYLGSAAVHPGGGVHGACGYLAARAALTDSGPVGRRIDGLRVSALRRWYADPAPIWAGLHD